MSKRERNVVELIIQLKSLFTGWTFHRRWDFFISQNWPFFQEGKSRGDSMKFSLFSKVVDISQIPFIIHVNRHFDTEDLRSIFPIRRLHPSSTPLRSPLLPFAWKILNLSHLSFLLLFSLFEAFAMIKRKVFGLTWKVNEKESFLFKKGKMWSEANLWKNV